MTSITGAGASGVSQPFGRVQNLLSREAASGAISATDQTAMTAALGDIGQTVAGGASPAAAAAPGAGAAPTVAAGSISERVNAAIDGEVSSGKLTSDQATELKAAFGQVQAQMHGGHAAHGTHGHGGGGGIAALLGTDTSTSTDPTGPTAASGATTPSNPLSAILGTAETAMQSFVGQFTAALQANGLYGATGSAASAARSLMVNLIG